MNQTLLSSFGTSTQRVEHALDALREGRGVMVLDDENRENEGDMIFAAENMTVEQMALTIRHGSGIVCLCITEDRRKQLELPMMVENNTSAFGTGFTVTIEAAHGVTTGVSAADRLTTVRAAIADDAKPSDLHRPGHVFPLRAQAGGVLCEHCGAGGGVRLTAGEVRYLQAIMRRGLETLSEAGECSDALFGALRQMAQERLGVQIRSEKLL